jgi:FkbM family methyltransferase
MTRGIHLFLRSVFRCLPPRWCGAVLRAARDFVPLSVRAETGLLDVRWSLRNAAASGLAPCSILDVGAHRGRWAEAVRPLFPDAGILLLEANEECRVDLEAAASRMGRASARIVLLGPREEDGVPFYRMSEGSSVLPELSDVPRTCARLPARTLDRVVDPVEWPGPYLLKLDVQGYELSVLEGAENTLARAEAVYLEVSYLPYNRGAPLFQEVVAFMARKGFLVYDLCSTHRRMSDGALFQGDVLWVREDGPLRAPRPFFSP